MPCIERLIEPVRISPAGEHFFFGYYDRYAVSGDGRHHIAVHPAFMDRPNTGADRAEIGLIDLHDGNRRLPLDDETAWNWQMGANAHWLGPGSDRIVYNVRKGDRVTARVRTIATADTRDLDAPVYCVSKDGRFAISVNFARIHANRPGYGYADVVDPWQGVAASDEDGLYYVDLETGTSRLIVSLACCRANDPDPTMDAGDHWFNHIAISPLGTRVMFLHRWRIPQGGHWSRLYTCDPDGGNLCLLNKGWGISHCDWRDEDHVLSFCHYRTTDAWAFWVMKDKTQDAEQAAEGVAPRDGHCSYRPGRERRWFANDTYPDPDTRLRTLMLIDTHTNTRVDLGRFLAPPEYADEIRCDLHPRWDPSGRLITFDSIHEGYRGIYLMDVSDVVGSSG